MNLRQITAAGVAVERLREACDLLSQAEERLTFAGLEVTAAIVQERRTNIEAMTDHTERQLDAQ